MTININNVTKRYGKVTALNDVSMSIGTGIFGFLGPNGAGKTTLMRILATLENFDAGSIEIKGVDLRASPGAIRKMIGYMPQYFGFYPDLTAYQTLDYISTMKIYPVNARGNKLTSY